MHRKRRDRAPYLARWMAGLLALSSGLIAGLARAADPAPQAAPQAAPQPAPQRALVLQPGIELQETYTDNAAFTSNDKISDFITRVGLSLDGTLDTGRAQGRLNANLGYDIYARETSSSGWYAAGNGDASYALIPDLLTLKANASTSDGALSTFYLSATNRHGAPGLVQQTTYDVGPELTGHTPDGLDVKAAARFAQVFYSNDSSSGSLAIPGNDTIGQLVGSVSTDPSRRLQLENSGEYLRDTQEFTSANDIQSAYFRLGEFRLIARVGYDYVTQGQVLHISAPLASAGFEYKPNSTSTITVEAGTRYNKPAFALDATFELSPRLLGTAMYVEEVQPDQVGVFRSFFNFTQAAEKLPPPLVPASFGVTPNIANQTSLSRSGTFRLLYYDEVNSIGVTGEWINSEYLTTPGRNQTLLFDAALTRRVHPDLTLVLHGDYAHTFESPIYGPSEALGASLQLAYRVNSHTDVSLNVAHTSNRQLVLGAGRVTETALFVTFRRAL